MARRGENIYKRKDGRWEGRYIKKRDSTGKAVYGYVYSSTYRDIRRKLHEAKTNIANGIQPDSRTLDTFSDEWLRLRRTQVKESTYVKYYNIVNRHIKPALGSLSPQSLTPLRIEEFSSSLLSRGLAPKTVRDILTVLRGILKYCIQTQRLAIPMPEIVYPQNHREEMRVLTPAEQNLFTSHLLDNLDAVSFGILLGLQTGMRIGEICALRWENISLENRTIHITSTMQRLQNPGTKDRKKTKIVIGHTKSQTSTRVIPLSKSLYELCSQCRPESGEGYVLTGDTEKYMEPRVLQYRLKKYTEACGLEGVHFHTLRHTFATRCIEVGFEVKSLSEILGHASTQVTMDRYVHSSMELKRTNMEKLAAVGF